jgi:Ti type entry exclusion protein TrbK
VSCAVVFALLALVAAVSSVATVLIVRAGDASQPTLTEAQRAAREKFFGSANELPPIKDGQEMRPRW